MWVAGIDGCRAGWVAFKIDLATRKTSVELVDLASWLRTRPADLACIAIDIPIGLLDGSRACDKAARKLLGRPRGSSVFSPPCRAALGAADHAVASATNLRITGRGLSQQAWGIAPKIRQVDDAITPDCQQWAYEVHPEVCFWALAGNRPMAHRKKIEAGRNERLHLLRPEFPEIDRHLQDRTPGVAKDDLLDAAVAAWTAIRISGGEAQQVCKAERDSKGLMAGIWY
jgi:predicted RNase H-like nuclease